MEVINIKLKKLNIIIVLFLATSIFLINHNATIAKNNIIISEPERVSIDEERAMEIAIDYFEKYFDIEIKANDYFQYNKVIKKDYKYNFTGKEYWSIRLSTFDESKLHLHGKTQEEIDKVYEERNKAIYYCACIDVNYGDVLALGIYDYNEGQGLSIEELRKKEIKTEDAKKIAREFIIENKLIDDIKELEFIGEVRIEPSSCYEIRVVSLSREIAFFSYTTKDYAEKAIKINKNNDKDGGIG